MGKKEGGVEQAAKEGVMGGSGRGVLAPLLARPTAHNWTRTRAVFLCAGRPQVFLTPGSGEGGGWGKKDPCRASESPRGCLKTLLLPPLEVVHQQPVQPASDNVRSTPNHPRQARSIIAALRGPA